MQNRSFNGEQDPEIQPKVFKSFATSSEKMVHSHAGQLSQEAVNEETNRSHAMNPGSCHKLSAERQTCTVKTSASRRPYVLRRGNRQVPINLIFRHARIRPFIHRNLSRKCEITISDSFGNNLAHMDTNPFFWGEIPNFILSSGFVNGLKNELSQLQFHRRDSDLFQFSQSHDLQRESSHYIWMFKKILLEKCIPWFRRITHFPLTDEVDMTCSVYGCSDVLLCHDDQMARRKIAFIYYLVTDWETSDGGTLDLFNSVKGQPTSVATSLNPEWNKFVFFEVGPNSFHQVSEVLSEKLRLSVSGWFHIPCDEQRRPNIGVEPLLLHVPKTFEGNLKDWIDCSYFVPITQMQVRKSFATNSEIELTSFLKFEKFLLVEKALRDTKESDWVIVGPVNKRHYRELVVIPPVVEECLTVLGSYQMQCILSKLTGLTFSKEDDVAALEDSEQDNETVDSTSSEEYCPNITKKHHLVVRKWMQGDYTLLHDDADTYFTLDLTLYFAPTGWSDVYGGYSSYIAKDDGCEMLRVEPKMNTLALVYRDRETDKFIKYVNAKSLATECASFFDINFAFSE